MRQRIYIWIAVGIALLLLFGSCRSIRYVPVETIRTDSLYLSVHERDSIHIKDFVYIKEKGDSVIVDKWHTVYRDRVIHDTTYIERVITNDVPYQVEKELTWWQKTKLELGEFSIGVILVLLIVVILLVKKKGGAR